MAEQKSTLSEEMKESKFHKLFIHELKDIYWAEKHLLKTLPKLEKAASSKSLAEALGDHVSETETHVQRIEEIFELMEEKPKAIKCEAMEGLLKEAMSILEDTTSDSMVRDAGIIIACQKVEHYEIASYGALISMAKEMKHNETAKILGNTLKEEKMADKKLTGLAESEINEKASEE